MTDSTVSPRDARRRPKRARGTATAGISAEMLEMFDRYLQERVDRRTMMESTARTSRQALNRLGRQHGDRPVSEISDVTAAAYMDDLAGLAPGTIRGRVAVAQGFCKWLVRNGYLAADPFYDIDKPRLPRYMPRGLTAEQVRDIFHACTVARDKLIVSLMVNEGLRCIEISRLQVHDVDFRDRMMRITGKGMHERVLPMTDETWSCLQIYLEDEDLIGGPMIRRRDNGAEGLPLGAQSVSDIVTELMSTAGVKRRAYDRVSAHALRHTAATDMLRRGAHVRDVQYVLGHSNLKSTETYMPARRERPAHHQRFTERVGGQGDAFAHMVTSARSSATSVRSWSSSFTCSSPWRGRGSGTSGRSSSRPLLVVRWATHSSA